MSSVLLFDLDGVLLDNPAISEYVTEKSVRYLQKHAKVPVRYKTYNHMKQLNRMAYKTLGHTALIVDDTRTGVWNYNDYVFDNETLNFVRHAINDSDRRRIMEIANTLISHNNLAVGLCTNTPLNYCNAVFDGLCYDMDKLFTLCFTSDTGLLKPTDNFFEHVEQELKNDFSRIHFMDDSERNVDSVEHRPLWDAKHVPTRKDLFVALRETY